MTRRCSHCTNKGHNSRTCPSRGGGVKLFGVRLTDGSMMKKSASMGNLSASHYHSSSSPNPESPSADEPDGYLSDDPARASCSADRRADRKKGVPWTEEEHRLFLMGLQKLGKGDWRGIARNYVVSRTPTQVASHAQKYFIRQTNATRRKRRSSLFDMVPDMASNSPPVPEEFLPECPEEREQVDDAKLSIPSLNLSLHSSEFESMEATYEAKLGEASEPSIAPNLYPTILPGFFPAYVPVPFPLWPPSTVVEEEEEEDEPRIVAPRHRVLKPIPIVANAVNVDELVNMSQLSLGEGERSNIESSPLTLKWLGEPSRQSAFQSNTPVSGSDIGDGKSNAIQAI